MPSELQQETHVFNWKPDYPLVTTAKRYWDPSTSSLDGYTLIFTHGAGLNKEQWEPTMKRIFDGINLASGPQVLIREAWAVDCPNHGDAAILNEKLLLTGGYDSIFTWEEYTRVLHLFLTQNPNIHFNEHKLIGISHSMGSVCLGLTLSYPHPPNFEMLIFCEPMLMSTDIPHDVKAQGVSLRKMTENRQDIWANKEAAFAALSSKRGFRTYDPEVLKLYIEHGMRLLPTALYPGKQGVTLKCTKIQETACYGDIKTGRKMYDFLPALCSRVPAHIIWGETDDVIPGEVKDTIVDKRKGRIFVSVSRVKGAGHFVIQNNPTGLSEAIISSIKKTVHRPLAAKL